VHALCDAHHPREKIQIEAGLRPNGYFATASENTALVLPEPICCFF
jgi:hypothetical protein